MVFGGICLKEKHPDTDFSLIMGGDNLGTFHKWKNHEKILEHYSLYVYKRPNYDLGQYQDHPKVKVFDAPQMAISSSLIRKMIKEGKNVRYFVTDEVFEAIDSGGMYI